MEYLLNGKLIKLEPYNPCKGEYKIKLDANESFFNCNEVVNDKISKAIKDIDFNRYPDPYADGLIKAFSEFYNVNQENVVVGNGSDELISIIVSCFLEKGDTILTLSPDFSMYAFYGNLYEVSVQNIQKNYNLTINIDKVINYCNNNNVKAIIFSNPCNPTSLGVKRNEVLKLLENVNTLVIVDEAYMDFWNESILDKVSDYSNLIVLRTCSKAIGLAGIRLGFAVAGKTITTALKAAKSPYNTDAVSQKIGECVLHEKRMITENIKNIIKSRDNLYENMLIMKEKYPIIKEVFKPCTNFCYIEIENADSIYQALLSRSIAIRNMNRYLRITAGSMDENKEFFRNMEDILKEMG